MAAANPIDEYLATLDEPKRATLASVRDTIMAIVPEAEQCISYGMPAFKLRGKTIAGFAAFTKHLSYLPHSGSVIPQLADQYQEVTDLRHPQLDPAPYRLERPASGSMADRFIRARGPVPPIMAWPGSCETSA